MLLKTRIYYFWGLGLSSSNQHSFPYTASQENDFGKNLVAQEFFLFL